MSQVIHQHESKVVNDPIHGHVNVYGYCLECIDTPQFQRLRDLKQLGTAYFVFPGSSHNRFEHSLGVSFLAGKWLEHFSLNQPELGITEYDMKMVRLAGLCHDLGHGVYSHVRKKPHLGNWTHEEMSCKMFNYMVEENSIDLDKDEITMVTELIHPPVDDNRILDVFNITNREKAFMYGIVCNQNNSVDVDKFDYLARDCHNCGVKQSFDHHRLMKFSKVIDDEICFSSKEAYNLYEMFHTRYSLFKSVYLHRVSKSVELMITEALLEADEFLSLSDACDDPERFTHLTDHIIKTIEASKERELEKSRQILNKVRKRDLYKCVGEMVIECQSEASKRIENLTEEEFVTYQSMSGPSLDPNDIIIDEFELNYAMKERNPVENIHFYESHSSNSESFTIDREQVSYLIPNQFQEKHVRVFCKSNAKQEIVSDTFRNLVQKMHLESTVSSSFQSSQSSSTTFPRKRKHHEKLGSGLLLKK